MPRRFHVPISALPCRRTHSRCPTESPSAIRADVSIDPECARHRLPTSPDPDAPPPLRACNHRPPSSISNCGHQPGDQTRNRPTTLHSAGSAAATAGDPPPLPSCACAAAPSAALPGTTVVRASVCPPNLPAVTADESSGNRAVGGDAPCPRCAGAATCCDPPAAGIAAGSRSCQPCAGRGALTAPAFGQTVPARAVPIRSPFFSQCFPRHLILKDRFGQQFLQPSVLRLKLFQPLGVRHRHPTKLGLPQVVTCLGEPVLPAQVLHPNPSLPIPQKANDLLFRIALLHGSDPFLAKSDSRS